MVPGTNTVVGTVATRVPPCGLRIWCITFTDGFVAVRVTVIGVLVQVMFWKVGEITEAGAATLEPMLSVCTFVHCDTGSVSETV